MSSPKHAICLPCLRKLTLIDGESDVAVRLLDRIIYPGTAAVKLILGGEYHRPYDYISSVVAGKLNGKGTLGAPPMPQSIHIKADNHRLDLTLWDDILPYDEIRAQRFSTDFDSTGRFSVLSLPPQDCTTTLLPQLPMSDLRSVLITQDTPEPNFLRLDHIVAMMPFVEQLALEYRCDNKGRLPPQVGSKDVGDPIEAELELLLPRLKVLKVREVHRPREDLMVADPTHAFETHRVAQSLMAMRLKAGSPFSELDVSVHHLSYGCCSARYPCVCGRSSIQVTEEPILVQETGAAVPCHIRERRAISSSVFRLFQGCISRRDN